MTFLQRLRLYLGGELSRLAAWLLPEIDYPVSCDDPPAWVICGRYPDDITFSCTAHLPDMVAEDTLRVEPYKPSTAEETCYFMYSLDDLEDALL